MKFKPHFQVIFQENFFFFEMCLFAFEFLCLFQFLLLNWLVNVQENVVVLKSTSVLLFYKCTFYSLDGNINKLKFSPEILPNECPPKHNEKFLLCTTSCKRCREMEHRPQEKNDILFTIGWLSFYVTYLI